MGSDHFLEGFSLCSCCSAFVHDLDSRLCRSKMQIVSSIGGGFSSPLRTSFSHIFLICLLQVCCDSLTFELVVIFRLMVVESYEIIYPKGHENLF